MILEHIIITACCCLKMVTWNAKSAWAVRMEDFELHGHQHINVYITYYFQNSNNNNNIITTNGITFATTIDSEPFKSFLFITYLLGK